MIDIGTVGMIVIFVMAFFIVSWQAERVRKAEDAREDAQAALEVTQAMVAELVSEICLLDKKEAAINV